MYNQKFSISAGNVLVAETTNLAADVPSVAQRTTTGEAGAAERHDVQQHEQWFSDRASEYQDRQEFESYRRSLKPSRVVARKRLADRTKKVQEQGLSNPAYLAASSQAQHLRIQIEPASVKFTFSDWIADHLAPQKVIGGKRGVIEEFSEASRQRLANQAWVLSAEGHIPQLMITLTTPANWEHVYLCDEDGVMRDEAGGRLFKRHVDTFRKRLTRMLLKCRVFDWSALWFLEFQTRGAPHIHFILFRCLISERVKRYLIAWTGRAWSDIVGNPSEYEKIKHCGACSTIEKMRSDHFGYACKYATKLEQKNVPEEFREVGRFWGVWNYKRGDPVIIEMDYSHLNRDEREFVRMLVSLVLHPNSVHSPNFVNGKLDLLGRCLKNGVPYKFGFTSFGAEAASLARRCFAGEFDHVLHSV